MKIEPFPRDEEERGGTGKQFAAYLTAGLTTVPATFLFLIGLLQQLSSEPDIRQKGISALLLGAALFGIGIYLHTKVLPKWR